MKPFLFAMAALPCLPLPSVAQTVPQSLTCTLAVICVEAGECQQWGQEIALREVDSETWQADWDAELTTDYRIAADLPAPEGAIEPVRMRTLMFTDPENQTVQMISFEEGGNIVVTMHQPHLRPRSVTGFGLCADARPEDAHEEEGAPAPGAVESGE